MKMPLAKGHKSTYPQKPLCPICKKARVFEPHSFAVVAGGALLMDRKRRNSRMNDALDGFLDLVWHGAHDSGKGVNQKTYAVVPIVDAARGGQFEIYVCSLRCLRRLFSEWVDSLEGAVNASKHKKRKRKTSVG